MMSALVKEISNMVDMLPESEQNLAYEFVKRIVLAWDPDYTKLTAAEKECIAQSRADFKNGDVYSHEDVWS